MLNVYGHFHIFFYAVHYVTFFGLLVLLINYLYRVKDVDAPVLFRLLLPGLYVFGGMVHYEIYWNFVWMFYRSYAWVDVFGFMMCEGLIIYTVNVLMIKKYKHSIPKINLSRWVVVSVIMIPLIAWLNVSGFFSGWDLLERELSTVDPHNFAWAMGKIFCLLSWLWIPEKIMD